MDALAALAASGPHPDHAEELMTFGRFVGDWDVEGTLIAPDGSRSEHRGEWLFGWVLEGRAVQDVLISPPRAGRPAGTASAEYGSSLRFYDAAEERWEVTWMTPVDGRVERLRGGRAGDDIVLEGTSSNGRDLLRWSFEEVAEDAFVWRGRRSIDRGATWRLEEEMRLRRRDGRRSPASAGAPANVNCGIEEDGPFVC
jgi:hypothetical protein